MVEISPFPYPGPLDPESVVGRDELVADLVERLTARRVTALVGPRRFGKTSALRKVRAELEAAATSVVWVDLYETRSFADLAMRLDIALSSSTGVLRRIIADHTAKLEIRLGFLNVEFARRRNEQPDPLATTHLLLDALVDAARRTPTTVVLDEFGGIADVDGAAGLLRTKLQHHFREIGLVFAGSQPSLMRWMFSAPEQPFYAQAELVEITPFDLATTLEVVGAGFAATGRDAGVAGAAIAEFTGGHPYRTMQLADAVWQHTLSGGRAGDAEYAAGLGQVRAVSALGNETLFSTFDTAERGVLRLVADRRPLFGVGRDLVGLSNSSVTAARDRLLAGGDIASGGRDLHVVDPVFGDWIRSRFPL